MGGGHSPRLVPSHFLEQYITPKNMIINFGVFFNVADVRIEHLKLCLSFFKSKQLYDQEHWILALKYRKFKSGTDSGCVHKNGTSANTFLPPHHLNGCLHRCNLSLVFKRAMCGDKSRLCQVGTSLPRVPARPPSLQENPYGPFPPYFIL